MEDRERVVISSKGISKGIINFYSLLPLMGERYGGGETPPPMV